MEKWNVYLTGRLPQTAIDLLKESCEVEMNLEDRLLTKGELMEKIKGRDAIITLLADKIDSEVIAAADKIKVIANYAVGYDNIDIKVATAKNIYVTNTPGVLTDTTADLAWALLFAVARRVAEADRYTRELKFKSWSPMLFLGQDISKKTLGIIGCGRIGQAFAKKAKGFEMKLLYHSNKPKADFEKETGAVYASKEELLRNSDFISLHVPLLPSTRYLIDEKELKLMKKTAILINTSRGPVVKEKALVKALKNNQIWGAGLDVYENEPALSPGLTDLDNVVILPHIGSASVETRTKMATMAVENILAVVKGEVPAYWVNQNF
jgi:lactate dehydrogenase-like 2-hydroxyacid dehydrogenase